MFRGTRGIVLACYSAQNIDRYVSIYRAALRADRDLVIDLYTAAVAAATSRDSIPQADWDRVKVFVPLSQRIRVRDTKSFDRVNAVRRARIFPEQITEQRERLVMTFRASMARDLERAGCLTGASAVWSMWPGYLRDSSSDGLQSFLERLQIPLSIIHASGHATVADLKRLAGALDAERIVPIHTAAPELFRRCVRPRRVAPRWTMVADLMATSAPANRIASQYAALLDKPKTSGLSPTDRYRSAAETLLEDPQRLVGIFRSSVEETSEYFAQNDPGEDPLYGSVRPDLTHEPGLANTAGVGALMEHRGRRRWDVLGDDGLSFYYIDRELLVTQAKGLPAPDSPGTASLRMDLLLANAEDGLPIVCELKVTSPRQESPDKNPFFALIQALACASYLLPSPQMRRLRRHDPEQRLTIDDGKLDIYVLTVREPPASKPWFELRDSAERLSFATIKDLGSWIRTIAFLELAWLDKPSRAEKRPPRATKRFAVTSAGPDRPWHPLTP